MVAVNLEVLNSQEPDSLSSSSKPHNHQRCPAKNSNIEKAREEPFHSRRPKNLGNPKRNFLPGRAPSNSGSSSKRCGTEREGTSNISEKMPGLEPQTSQHSTTPSSRQQQQRAPRANRNSNQKQSSAQRSGSSTFFKPYFSDDDIRSGLKSGTLLKGQLRINQRKYEEAFMDNPKGSEFPDIAILGMSDRNRALQGDVVAICIKPRCSWVVIEDAYKHWKKSGHESTKAVGSTAEKGMSQSEVLRSTGDIVEIDERIDGEIMDTEMKISETVESVTAQDEPECFAPTDPMEVVADSGEAVTLVSASTLDIKSVKKKSYRLLSDLPLEEWCLPDDCLQQTAEVVGIVEAKNTRLAMGRLEPFGDQRKWAKFSPSDSRIPRVMIEASQLPKDFFERPHDFNKFLFLARIVDWPQNSVMAHGNLEKELGLAGDIDAETEGSLAMNGVDTREFSEEVIACLPSVPESGWKISEEEIAKRRDLRDEITFTIDPKTARDLDDALSISYCEDVDGCGTPGWEVGVHIADVTYFVCENTELDEWALERATSVYLVHQVVPMLPRLLCEELCSLNTGVDRLSFSVLWKMDEKGNIYDEWFGRTVIRSRVKLTYEHAQDFIDNPEKDFLDSEMPKVSDGTTVHQLKEKVLLLNNMAKILRQKRRESGSLQLDQPKLKFALDDDNKSPIGVSIYEAKDSNKLVEEFMLLANMAVARKIERHYRKTALLRCHPPPKTKVLRDALKLCNTIGFPIDGTSSAELSRALAPFRTDSRLLRSINQVLSMILMKAMELARYFCTGSVSSQTKYHHYALNVPFYTHFTSPIRRYPDIIVHRLLAASLNYCEPSGRTVEELEKIAQHCNDKKLIAKKVGEASAETFFAILVQKVGSMEAKGVVVNVLDMAFDVLLIKYGVVKRVYVTSLEMRRKPSFEESSARLTLYWSTDDGTMEQLIQMCTIVDVVLSGDSDPTKFQAVIKPKSKKDSPTLMELWRELESTDVDASVLNIDSMLLDG